MNRHLFQACEGVDASVFSGDVLYNDEDRAELKKYVARWQRAIDEHEAPEQAEAQAKSEPAASDARDAARYRLLRDMPAPLTALGLDVAWWENCEGSSIRGEELDKACDAAIAATQERKPW